MARKKTLDDAEELNYYAQRAADWEEDRSLPREADSLAKRTGQIMKAIGDGDDWADIVRRLKFKPDAKRQKKFGLVLGDRALLRNTQVTASTTAPFAPAMDGW